MCLNRGACGCGITFLDCVIDRLVLVQQFITCCALSKHYLTIVKHAFAQQFIHGPHHVQHDDVMTCLDNGKVKFGVQLRFVGWISLCVCCGHFIVNGLDHP